MELQIGEPVERRDPVIADEQWPLDAKLRERVGERPHSARAELHGGEIQNPVQIGALESRGSCARTFTATRTARRAARLWTRRPFSDEVRRDMRSSLEARADRSYNWLVGVERFTRLRTPRRSPRRALSDEGTEV